MKNVDFVSTLMDMRSGKVAMECSEKLNRVIRAIMETGKPGTLALKLTVTPKKIDMKRGVSEVEIKHKCTTVEPEMTLGPSVFFTTEDGGLSRIDPDQMEMEYEPTKEKTNG